MKKQLIIIFIILFSFASYAQKGNVYFDINYNTFLHSSLKSFQKEFKNDIPEVPIMVNDNFPANIGFTLGYNIKHTKTSFFVSYNTTGGKISYADYSGVIRLTEPLKGYTLGGEYRLQLIKENNNFHIGIRGFTTFSNLKINSYTQILDNITESSIELQSIDLGAGGNFIYEYPLSFFTLRATLGFDVVFGGNLRFKDNYDYHIENNSGDAVRTNWTGLRSGIGISFPL